MTRDDIYSLALQKMRNHMCIVLELATGTGKSKIAIDLANAILKENSRRLKILLLVAKTVHKGNWLAEIAKWGGFTNNPDLTVECYNSLRKHENADFDIVIADEAPHLNSELRRSYFSTLRVKYRTFFLSATFPGEMKQWLDFSYRPAWITATLQDTIAGGILPEPKILLLPLFLDDKRRSEHIILNRRAGGKPVRGIYRDYWKYVREKTYVDIEATPMEKCLYFNSKILSLKNCFQRTGRYKLMWLKTCADRLAFLANSKNETVYRILSHLKDRRTLTFCNSILQTEVLGKYCIHSREKRAVHYLSEFNEGRIKHITACQMLNEGMNLMDCQYGIFANLNASQCIAVQRIGRLLRHRHPVIIIPYYKGTREEEIMQKMLEGYDRKFITMCSSLQNLYDNL